MKWVIKRIFPPYKNIFKEIEDWLEIWKGAGAAIANGHNRWFEGFVSDQFLNHRTIFDDYEYAEMVALVMAYRWPNCTFEIVPLENTKVIATNYKEQSQEDDFYQYYGMSLT